MPQPALYIDELDHNADWPKRAKDTLRALLGKAAETPQTAPVAPEVLELAAGRIVDLILEAAGSEKGRWITLDSGAHVLIDDDGTIMKGFGKGKNVQDLPDKNIKGQDKGVGKPAPQQPATKPQSPAGSPQPSAAPAGVPPQSKSTSAFNAQEWEAKSVPDRIDAWKALDVRERDRLADAPNTVNQRRDELLEGLPEQPNTGDLTADVTARVSHFQDRIAEPALKKIGVACVTYSRTLEQAGVSPELSRTLAMQATDLLAAQEMESMSRSLGDHGIYHIGGNIDMANDILKAHPGQDQAQDLALMMTAQLFHDSGYLTPPSRSFMDEGHPRWSAHYYREHVADTVAQAFGKHAASEVEHMIRTHDARDIDWTNDPIGSAVRIADNTALFHEEKIPGFLRYAPDNLRVLTQLANKEIDLNAAKAAFKANLQNAHVPEKTKALLMRAADEVSPVTPKFTLGMLGGQYEGVEWAGDHMVIKLSPNEFLTRLHKLGDFGQRQFAKFAEAYGIDPEQFKQNLNFRFRKPDGTVALEGRIVQKAAESVFRAALRFLVESRLRGKAKRRIADRVREAVADWEEHEHPRDDDGKFTHKGGGAATRVTDENYQESDPKQRPLPGVFDAPEKQVKLEWTSKAALKECERIITDADGEEIDSYKTWEDLDEDAQSEIRSSWIDDHYHEYEDEPLQEWRDELYRDAQSEIEKDQAFAEDFVKDNLRDMGLDPAMVDENILSVAAYYPYPTISWTEEDEDKIRWLDPDEHEGESALDAVAAIDEGRDWPGFEDAVNEAAQSLAEEREQEGPPDYVTEVAFEAALEAFERLSDDEKTKIADDHGSLEKTITVEIPDEWKPYKNGENYRKTKSCARYMQQRLTEKTLAGMGVDVEKHAESIGRLAGNLWGAWKGSSTSDEGLLMQYVTADILGGDRQQWPQEAMDSIDSAAKLTDRIFGGKGDVERGKEIAAASVRATWAASQYVLRQAGKDTVELYRAVLLPGDAIDNEPTEKVQVDTGVGPGMEVGFERFTGLTLKKNGAASATTKPGVANSWGGVGVRPENPVRVVMRIRAPREAAISIPCFGQNYINEEEVVVAGTHWDKVEFWKDKAPPFELRPME